MRLTSICLIMTSMALAGLSAVERRAVPEGTVVSASFRCDTGPEALIDGDEKTFMQAAGGTDSGGPTSVFLRFPQPLGDLTGVITGDSDRFHNYYPQEMEFWADSNGDGRYDTRLGRTDDLGPAAECRGEHAFDGRLPQVHGLELRVTRQHSGGGKRAWTMNEIRLLHNQDVPTITATPTAHRVSYFLQAIPAGTTARSSKATEPGNGPELLLDGDGETVMTHRGGTYRKDQPTSVFLTFPQPVADLAGLVFGRGGPYGTFLLLGRSTPRRRGMLSALTLLVLGVGADDADAALALDHLAVLAAPPDGREHFHDSIPSTFMPRGRRCDRG